MIFDGIQDFSGEVHEAACYALCLSKVGELYLQQKNKNASVNIMDIFDNSCGPTKEDIIYYNRKNLNDNNNFFVQHPDELVKMITGKKVKVWKEYNLSYKPEKNEFIIKRYERVKTGITYGHFDMDNFHPIKDSYTVKYGKLVSLRIVKIYE